MSAAMGYKLTHQFAMTEDRRETVDVLFKREDKGRPVDSYSGARGNILAGPQTL